MKKTFFKFLNKVNKRVLPRYSKHDPASLTKTQKMLLAYRYYVLIQALD